MNRMIALALALAFSLQASEDYQFAGRHFIASYSGCEGEALQDAEKMLQAMDEAVAVCGATLLDKCSYAFTSNGVTAAYLLSESHASIHSYPEHKACFVDLFTCGDRCSAEKFDAVLRQYLKPQHVNAKFLQRTEESEEISYSPLAVE
jgi:S-adenosylmethionine decarboxylase